MEAIRRIVQEIKFICRVRSVQVSDTLSAFMARAVVLENATKFPLDKELNESDVQELIKMACERLCEEDSPPLETVKMQVALDAARLQEGELLEQQEQERERRESGLIAEVSDMRLKPGNDVEALTSLYRKIFNYLVVRAGLEPGADRPAEREIAAALESVFPRIGLKSFIQLTSEEKRAQLNEMAKIVMGIRLYNREVGKGGAGLDNIEEQVYNSVMDLKETLEVETAELNDVVMQYQETIVYCQLRAPAGVTPKALERWKDELANRRQYLSYLSSLQEDVIVSVRKVTNIRESFMNELDELQGLVGGRTSVPKEHVYPKFEQIATSWLLLVDELKIVEARIATLEELHSFRDSYVASLTPDHAVFQAAQLEGVHVHLGHRARPFGGIVDRRDGEQEGGGRGVDTIVHGQAQLLEAPRVEQRGQL